jgi:thymidylate synthase (FAD)
MTNDNKVLTEDGIGYVEFIDVFGTDMDIVKAARVTTSTNSSQEKDIGLLHYLIKAGHLSTTEHVVFKFKIKCPIFIARQIFRHRLSSFSELSGRYATSKCEYYIPTNIREQVDKHTVAIIDDNEEHKQIQAYVEERFKNHFKICTNLYNDLLEEGVAKEIARMILPLSLYTEFMWTINARSLINFLLLRNNEHAQLEMQEYASIIEKFFADSLPETYSAFLKYLKYNEDISIEE